MSGLHECQSTAGFCGARGTQQQGRPSQMPWTMQTQGQPLPDGPVYKGVTLRPLTLLNMAIEKGQQEPAPHCCNCLQARGQGWPVAQAYASPAGTNTSMWTAKLVACVSPVAQPSLIMHTQLSPGVPASCNKKGARFPMGNSDLTSQAAAHMQHVPQDNIWQQPAGCSVPAPHKR